MSKNDIEHNFSLATEWVLKNKMPATNEEKLLCYGYYKQATEGDINYNKPTGILNIVAVKKWEEWNSLKGVTQDNAKKIYIEFVDSLKKKYKK